MIENCSSLKDREELVRELVEYFSESKEDSSVCVLHGNLGLGKKTVMNKVISKLSNNSDYDFLKIELDEFILNDKKGSDKRFTLSFRISLGIVSLNASQQNSSKSLLNKFIDFLRDKSSSSSGVVLFCVSDFWKLQDDKRFVIDQILENKKEIEERSGKVLKFFISNNMDSFSSYVPRNSICFKNLCTEDLKTMLSDRGLKLGHIENLDEKLSKINSICSSNMNLIFAVAKDYLNENLEFLSSFNQIIDKQFKHFLESNEYNSNAEDIREVILTASLSFDRFHSKLIRFVSGKDERLINNALNAAEDQLYIEQYRSNLYDFICEEMKSYFSEKAEKSEKDKILMYYRFFTKNYPEEYLSRAKYLIKYQGELTKTSFDLLILALSKAFLFKDYKNVCEIKKIVEDSNSQIDFSSKFFEIENVFSLFVESKFKEVNEILSIRNKYNESVVVMIELNRLHFRSLITSGVSDNSDQITTIVSLLSEKSKMEIKISNVDCIEDLNISDEIALRLRVICEISPYVLDLQNNRDEFVKLYHAVEKILHSNDSQKNELYNYVKYIFYRKAFLFMHPSKCFIYYDEAKQYFNQNEIWDEFIITLICQAGTEIVNSKYKVAIELLNEAELAIINKKIDIPKKEKLENNKLIASFLNSESLVNYAEAKEYAQSTISKLRKLLKGEYSATEHVILTNIASLSLYCGNNELYLESKKMLEKSLKCKDISSDLDVNDFYRYFFSWFEAFRAIDSEDWERALEITKALHDFTPALFLWEGICEQRYNSLHEIVLNKKKISAHEFCHELVGRHRHTKDASKFLVRGLMLSDLQYTSTY